MLKCVLSIFRLREKIIPAATIASQMDRVAVRSAEGDERMHISLLYKPQGLSNSKEVNVNRPKTEELSETLKRLGINITKKLGKKKIKSLGVENAASIALIKSNNGEVREDLPNKEAWSTDSILAIKVEDRLSEYKVVINPPNIKSLKLPDCLLAGFPAQPAVDGEFIDLNKCIFRWYRSIDQTGSENDEAKSDQLQKKKKRRTSSSTETWQHLYDGPIYTIQNTDVGAKLKLVCIPCNNETTWNEVDVISKSTVQAGPGHTPFEARHLLTEALTDDYSLRVVSYNILADIYADSDYSRDVLFSHCPDYALSMDYRKHLLLKEIAGYNSDIVCLQEVDSKVFRKHLLPGLTNHGYEGLLKTKSTDVREGSATFFRTCKLRLVEQHDIHLKEELQEKEVHKDLWEKISHNERMEAQMRQRTTVLQVTVLECVQNPNQYVIVGNTHLYFHPKAGNVRMLQSFVCLHHLEHLKNIYLQQGKEATVVFCGDLNSPPLFGAIDLITNGSVPSHHSDWFSGGKPYLLEGIELKHGLELTSACGYPDYTNYVGGFHACLDYIFVEEKRLSVKRVVPLPSHDEVTRFTALPNPVFPSDHVALVCDLQWVNRTEASNTVDSV